MPESGGRLRDVRCLFIMGEDVEALEALPVLAGDRARATSTSPRSDFPLPTAATRRLSLH
ncbi:MAG: hypothetical protein CL725_10180 [Chloroflexi bacterium]|nr:hypothetical protein [Chloroflexota bacterium]